MCTPRISAAVLLLFGAVACAQNAPGLGEAVSPEALETLDYAVQPDGSGLPAGSGTAVEGAGIYLNHCFSCHGEKGQDGINDRLAGGHDSLTSARPIKTVGSFWPYATTVFDYVRRAMPYQTPGVLSNDELYAVTAYLLFINDVVAENAVIDAASLPQVRMPNRDNFVWDYSAEDQADR